VPPGTPRLQPLSRGTSPSSASTEPSSSSRPFPVWAENGTTCSMIQLQLRSAMAASWLTRSVGFSLSTFVRTTRAGTPSDARNSSIRRSSGWAVPGVHQLDHAPQRVRSPR
jgi:hypothetical protein